MLKTVIKVLILSSITNCIIIVNKNRNILSNHFKGKRLTDLNEWRNTLRNDFRDNLQKLPDDVKKGIIGLAETTLKTKWKTVTAMDYLDYKLTGMTAWYLDQNMDRRERLESLVLAELLTNNGKYMNEVLNGLWLILEESSWVYPQNMHLQKVGIDLPDPGQWPDIIDIGVGESSAFVAWTKFLLGDKLANLSSVVNKRIDMELNERIFRPYLAHNYDWMGFNNKKTNNWNTVINSNALMSALLNLNHTRVMEIVRKSIESVDHWLNSYGDEGGCDEGTYYWGESAGGFVQFLYYLTSISKPQMVWTTQPLLKGIGSYIYKMYIDGNYFVDFGEADSKTVPEPNIVYRFGQLTGDHLMNGFAAYLYQNNGKDSPLSVYAQKGSLHQFYLQMIAYNNIRELSPKAPQLLETWLPDIQVLTMRSNGGSAKGLFLAAKAGTNGESHNHNDVGNFVIYVDGQPAIIDIGMGTLTAKHFGKERFTIWNLQSQWHNCPSINGIQQKDGITFAAKNVNYVKLQNGGHLDSDISGAYPPEAKVKSWIRRLAFDRSSGICLNETYSLSQFVKPFKLHFISALTPSPDSNSGTVLFQDNNNNTKLIMSYNPAQFDALVQVQNTTDDKWLVNMWGPNVFRVNLVSKLSQTDGQHSICFHL